VTVGRLLIVDDDPEFGELVRKVGARLDFDVEVTNDGESFKRKYEAFDPSVTVLDVIMPDIEGIELIQWLGEQGADVHVIVVTGYTSRYAVLAKKLAEAQGLRSVNTLSKPIRLQELEDALNRTIEH
jgi:DNA-binding NtrC family response regulator